MRPVRVAAALWIVWAFAVWNVVFDRVLVLAGRRYVYDAAVAAQNGRYLWVNERMRPAIARGLWTATLAAAAILVVGAVAITLAARREDRRRRPPAADRSPGPEPGQASDAPAPASPR